MGQDTTCPFVLSVHLLTPALFCPFPQSSLETRAPQYVQGAFTNAGPVEKAMLANLPLFSSDHHFLLYYSDTDISVVFYLFYFFIAQWIEDRKSGRNSNRDGFKLGPLSHLINSSNS